MRVHVVAVVLAVTGFAGAASALSFVEPVDLVQELAQPMPDGVHAPVPAADAAPLAAPLAGTSPQRALDAAPAGNVLATLRETLDHIPILFLLPGGDLMVPASAMEGGVASGALYVPARALAADAPAIPNAAPQASAGIGGAPTIVRDELSAPWRPSSSTRAFAPPTSAGGSPETAATVGFAMGMLALAGLALYHRIRPHSALENETRKVIFDAVCAQPGLGVHEVARSAGVSYSTATYHLERLVGAGMLVMTPDGNKLCYYKNGGAFTESERKILPLVKNDEAVRLFEAILDSPGTYRAALAERLGVTATTINWHLRRLRDAGLVDETRAGRSAFLTARAAAMRESFSSLAVKVGESDPVVAARLRRYAGDMPSDASASA